MGKLEARYLVPGVEQYDVTANGRKFSHKLGWTPWEPVLGFIDGVASFPTPAAPAAGSVDTPVATSN
eukprot:gene35271-biopygen23042